MTRGTERDILVDHRGGLRRFYLYQHIGGPTKHRRMVSENRLWDQGRPVKGQQTQIADLDMGAKINKGKHRTRRSPQRQTRRP